MKSSILKNIVVYSGLLLLLTLLWMSPLFLYYWQYGSGMSLWRSGIVSLCLSAIILLPSQKWLKVLLCVLMCCSTIVELFMVNQFGLFLTHTHALTIFGTNMQETNSLLSANTGALHVLVPFVLLAGVSIFLVCRMQCSLLVRGCSSVVLLSVLVSGVGVQTVRRHSTWSDTIENTFAERIPVNFWEKMYSASAEIIAISHSKTMTFGAYNLTVRPQKEVVVLAIGESVRYQNFSMNGCYERNTTPLLQRNPNAVLFTDYTTTGCITMLAVPMILTRGTPAMYDLTYKECGVQRAFQEVGFHTVAFCNNLIGDRLHRYLLNGADEVIPIEKDAQIPYLVDSLAQQYAHLFVYFQLQGSHAYYTNYTENFNRWRPNSNSDGTVASDSLLLNAYDNTILYTDYILNGMLIRINNTGGG